MYLNQNLEYDYLKNIKELNTNGFYMRMRKEKNRDGKVYYDGYKPFILDKKCNIKLYIDKFLRFNSTNLNKSITNSTKQKLTKSLKENRDLFYENYILTKITFTRGNKISDEEFNEAIEKLENLANTQVEEERGKYTLNGNSTNINLEYDIAKLLYHDYKKANTNVFKDIRFKYQETPKNITLEESKVSAIKLIKDYEEFTKIELEKKYQHKFLLHTHENTNLFPKKAIPFEEEYYITEGENTKKFNLENNGRIDCIFYSIDDGTLTDIYLIEIKVDDKVIDAKNEPGILEHLQDINRVMTDQGLKSYFLDNLIKNMNYRRETLGEKQITTDKYTIHFYTVVGFTNNDERKKVEDKLEKTEYKEKLKSIMNNMKDECDAKIFLDVKNWDPTCVSPSFEYRNVL